MLLCVYLSPCAARAGVMALVGSGHPHITRVTVVAPLLGHRPHFLLREEGDGGEARR